MSWNKPGIPLVVVWLLLNNTIFHLGGSDGGKGRGGGAYE